MQFHWWDYRDNRYLDALSHLADLRDEGKLREVALTNFDTQRMQDIADHGVRVVSNQVQYSLIDRRPEVAMAAFCQATEARCWPTARSAAAFYQTDTSASRSHP